MPLVERPWGTIFNEWKYRGKDSLRNFRIVPQLEQKTVLNLEGGTHAPISDIIRTRDIIAIIFEDGESQVWHRWNGNYLGSLLENKTQVVRTACYNSHNDTFIIVWHLRHADLGLRIKIFDAAPMAHGIFQSSQSGKTLQGLAVNYPGFVECVDHIGRILTSTVENEQFTLWNMLSYEELFHIPNSVYRDVRLSSRTVAFFGVPSESQLPVLLCDIHTGKKIFERSVPLLKDTPLISLELSNDHLLINQDGSCLRTINLRTGTRTQTLKTESLAPRALGFLETRPNSGRGVVMPILCISPGVMDLLECSEGVTCRRYSIYLPATIAEHHIHCDTRSAFAFIYLCANTRACSLMRVTYTPEGSRSDSFDIKGGLMYRSTHTVRDLLNAPAKRVAVSSPQLLIINLNDGDLIYRLDCPGIPGADYISYDAQAQDLEIGYDNKIYRLGAAFFGGTSKPFVQ